MFNIEKEKEMTDQEISETLNFMRERVKEARKVVYPAWIIKMVVIGSMIYDVLHFQNPMRSWRTANEMIADGSVKVESLKK